MQSVLVKDTEHCIFCNALYPEEHHIFFGPDRNVCDKYHLTIPLCNRHHTGSGDSPHMNRIIDLALKCWAQSYYEEHIGTRDDFRREFRKSYL